MKQKLRFIYLEQHSTGVSNVCSEVRFRELFDTAVSFGFPFEVSHLRVGSVVYRVFNILPVYDK